MKINDVIDQIIADAIKAHRYFGPDLFEQVYKACLFRELEKAFLISSQGGKPSSRLGRGNFSTVAIASTSILRPPRLPRLSVN